MTHKKPECDLPLMKTEGDNLVLFHPHVAAGAAEAVADTLRTRWIGQGPKVEEFERRFLADLGIRFPGVAVGAGTDALHLAYLLTDLQPDDEVIVPVFTCTATNIPLLYHNVRVRFADIQRDTLNIDVDHVRRLVNEKVKAIVCVHYGGLPCDMDELLQIGRQWGIPIIEDAAHAVGATYHREAIGNLSPFTMFSFQAIKHLTTGDGGFLVIQDEQLIEKAKRLRWFGIDRRAKQEGHWQNDIVEVGYKYQMNDIAAAIGLAGLVELPQVLAHRRRLFRLYQQALKNHPDVRLLGAEYEDREHACWLCTVDVPRREDLVRKLRDVHIEAGQVHYRNDRYSIFREFVEPGAYPNMDALESRYLVLPLHTKLRESDVQRICDVIGQGW
jgi:dTDP-4-amino-4,6-dideoxygalactose transaminase